MTMDNFELYIQNLAPFYVLYMYTTYLKTTVPSACRSTSSKAYIWGSPADILLIVVDVGRLYGLLPADFRRKSKFPSSFTNDTRDCFGCNDNLAAKLEHLVKPSLPPET